MVNEKLAIGQGWGASEGSMSAWETLIENFKGKGRAVGRLNRISVSLVEPLPHHHNQPHHRLSPPSLFHWTTINAHHFVLHASMHPQVFTFLLYDDVNNSWPFQTSHLWYHAFILFLPNTSHLFVSHELFFFFFSFYKNINTSYPSTFCKWLQIPRKYLLVLLGYAWRFWAYVRIKLAPCWFRTYGSKKERWIRGGWSASIAFFSGFIKV